MATPDTRDDVILKTAEFAATLDVNSDAVNPSDLHFTQRRILTKYNNGGNDAMHHITYKYDMSNKIPYNPFHTNKQDITVPGKLYTIIENHALDKFYDSIVAKMKNINVSIEANVVPEQILTALADKITSVTKFVKSFASITELERHKLYLTNKEQFDIVARNVNIIAKRTGADDETKDNESKSADKKKKKKKCKKKKQSKKNDDELTVNQIQFLITDLSTIDEFNDIKNVAHITVNPGVHAAKDMRTATAFINNIKLGTQAPPYTLRLNSRVGPIEYLCAAKSGDDTMFAYSKSVPVTLRGIFYM